MFNLKTWLPLALVALIASDTLAKPSTKAVNSPNANAPKPSNLRNVGQYKRNRDSYLRGALGGQSREAAEYGGNDWTDNFRVNSHPSGGYQDYAAQMPYMGTPMAGGYPRGPMGPYSW